MQNLNKASQKVIDDISTKDHRREIDIQNNNRERMLYGRDGRDNLTFLIGKTVGDNLGLNFDITFLDILTY